MRLPCDRFVRSSPLAAMLPAGALAGTAIVLNAGDTGRVFEGVGGVGAPAPPPATSSTILPSNGPRAGATSSSSPSSAPPCQRLKVEIGGGENSTDGSEPIARRHPRRTGPSKARGYEFWLMAEARKRNIPRCSLTACRGATPAGSPAASRRIRPIGWSPFSTSRAASVRPGNGLAGGGAKRNGDEQEVDSQHAPPDA